jgi:hypothetical protein
VIATNNSAWDLLEHILDEKGFVQAHLPHDIVRWITEESRQEHEISIPAKVDEIEKEVDVFKQRLQTDGQVNGDSGEWRRGWKQWEGEWVPRPIGV